MIGLSFIIFFVIYFVLARFVVRATMKWARRRNQPVRLWGVLVTILMLSPVFWDFIPVYGTYYYQCASQGGFTVYKTLDEWREENPRVAETLLPFDGRSTVKGETTRYQLNQRFVWDTTRTNVWHTLYKKNEKIIDIKAGKVLAENIDFYTNLKNPFVTPKATLSDFKIWGKINYCNKYFKDKWLVGHDSFSSLKNKFKHINGEF